MQTRQTGDLEIMYQDVGGADAPVVLLLHGWPDDATTWDAITPSLSAAGLRVVAPMLRGFGGTRFLSPDSPRTGNPGIHALDLIGLLDAIGVTRFAVVGHDWGSNIAEALAVGWPDRVERLCMMATPPRLGGLKTPPFEQAQLYWYHWFMATKRGEAAVRADRRGFAHLHWVNWAPDGWFDEATFDRVAQSWDNLDWVDVTLHSYRSRWDEAEPDPRSLWLENKIKSASTLSLPSLFIKGDSDGVTSQAMFAKVPEKFDGPFALIGLPDVGHFPTREAPEAVADILGAFLTSS